MERVDVAIVGAGAAGLMAAIHAGRTAPGLRILALDGAEVLGRKILVSGGGRCNVTHDLVTERDYAGGTPAAIRKILRRFDERAVARFFADRGVDLVREEETGKLFPRSNRARSVLEALRGAADDAGVEFRHPWRVERVQRREEEIVLEGPAGRVAATALVLATGGRSLPETGSDGRGYDLARALGHTTTPRIVQALVPLLLPDHHPLTALSGISLDVGLCLLAAEGGRRLHEVEGAMLLTHFGLSGPAVLDMSRHWILATADDPRVRLCVDWVPEHDPASLDRWLRATPSEPLLSRLKGRLPRRLAEKVMADAGLPADLPGAQLRREARRALGEALREMALPVTGPRGWRYAEVTAGGIPLPELHLDRMESRRAPGLFLCGEILEVDGRIGGFNFQWAWSTGAVAGRGAAEVAACRMQT